MLPIGYIEEWKKSAPWPRIEQVEQDMVIEKAMLELFSDPFLQERLAFKGGTALHKVFLKPQSRYSEDIDLMQIKAEPIGDTIRAIRKQLEFLGQPVVKQKKFNNVLVFRFKCEIPPFDNLRLKIEINCREHFTVLGYKEMEHNIENPWVNGSCKFITFEPEEMLGTKLCAIYQRKKGRDLFDLYYALNNLDLDTDKIIRAYKGHMAFSVDKPPNRKQFLQNMEKKLEDHDYSTRLYTLLRPGIAYDHTKAYELVRTTLIERIFAEERNLKPKVQERDTQSIKKGSLPTQTVVPGLKKQYDFLTGTITDGGIKEQTVAQAPAGREKLAAGTLCVDRGKDKPKEYFLLLAAGEVGKDAISKINAGDQVKVMGKIRQQTVKKDNQEHLVKKIIVKEFRVLKKRQDQKNDKGFGI
jgi:predicted nucleotidyltransferase component of viral defense system